MLQRSYMRFSQGAGLGALLLSLLAPFATARAQSTEELPPVVVQSEDAPDKADQNKKKPQASAAQTFESGVVPPEGMMIESANRTPTEAAKVGSTVEVLTQKDIDKQSKSFLKDYLTQLPGVYFSQDGPPGNATRLSIRGVGLKYVKVLVDGIDVSDPSGVTTETQFQHMLVGDVSRIEVLKGSQSMLYGGDAIGGVISIETNTATKPGLSQSGAAEYGAFNTFRGAYTAGYAATDGSNVSFTVEGINTDGFSAVATGTEDDGYRNLTLSSRGTYKVSDEVSLFFAARTLDARNEYDDFGVDGYNIGDTTQHAGRAGVDIKLLDGAFENTFAIQGMRINRDFFEPANFTPNSFYDGERVKAEYKGLLRFNDQLALLAGADWEEISLENSNAPQRPRTDQYGTYAQLMMEPVEGLILTGGARIDAHSTFGEFQTYRLTGAYLVPGTGTKLRATLGTGFRAPALDELFGSYPAFGTTYYGNVNLQPEESESWDAGIEQGLLDGRVRLSATYFELDTSNAIVFSGACTPVQPCMVNVPGVTHRDGVELAAVVALTDTASLTAGYSYTDTQTATGERLSFVPRHNFVVGVDFKPIDKVDVNVTAQVVSDTVQQVFGAGLVPLDDYVLVSAKAAYEFMPGWKAYVRGDNLLDQDYQTVIGYGTAGLAVYGGLQMSLPDNE